MIWNGDHALAKIASHRALTPACVSVLPCRGDYVFWIALIETAFDVLSLGKMLPYFEAVICKGFRLHVESRFHRSPVL